MKRNYMAPEAEIEMFSKRYWLTCSDVPGEGGGNEGGDNEYEI